MLRVRGLMQWPSQLFQEELVCTFSNDNFQSIFNCAFQLLFTLRPKRAKMHFCQQQQIKCIGVILLSWVDTEKKQKKRNKCKVLGVHCGLKVLSNWLWIPDLNESLVGDAFNIFFQCSKMYQIWSSGKKYYINYVLCDKRSCLLT